MDNWTSYESRAPNRPRMCTALTHIRATEGLETSSWQTKYNMAVDL